MGAVPGKAHHEKSRTPIGHPAFLVIRYGLAGRAYNLFTHQFAPGNPPGRTTAGIKAQRDADFLASG